MREKFLDLMKSEGLRPSQLAEILEVNPAGISHIIAGRNKPGYDLLQKILRRFPRINPDWLILDEGPMYRSEQIQTSEEEQPELSSSTSPSKCEKPVVPKSENQNERSTEAETPRNDNSTGTTNSLLQTTVFETTSCADNRQVVRVIICYDNHTFESYTLNSPTMR